MYIYHLEICVYDGIWCTDIPGNIQIKIELFFSLNRVNSRNSVEFRSAKKNGIAIHKKNTAEIY